MTGSNEVVNVSLSVMTLRLAETYITQRRDEVGKVIPPNLREALDKAIREIDAALTPLVGAKFQLDFGSSSRYNARMSNDTIIIIDGVPYGPSPVLKLYRFLMLGGAGNVEGWYAGWLPGSTDRLEEFTSFGGEGG